ncbi:MAG: tRNA (adenosine(37)-N6)-threonylcarbamoyltransferase complex dimerization subunit type 1 TsaB [Phycisphaerae bacterium]|nr:tRNA (adenosine(37)-N6)-threonylcarbamoyltransferase complex dimerization subunit type 1 TsaB [Phycisphaerae bacterium]
MRSVCLTIETSCRAGGVALALDGALTAVRQFDASSRHATTLLVRLRELLTAHGLVPANVTEVYVSVGPGSFTGVRVGVTVARTLAQAMPGVKTVAVPTTHAVAENARALPWQHLAVVLDAKDEFAYVQSFQRETPHDAAPPQPAGPPRILTPQQMLAEFPRPVTLIGEGLAYHHALREAASATDGSAGEPTQRIILADPALHLPTAESVYHVGQRLAHANAGTDYHNLLPIYARKSEAERLWEEKQRQA